MRTQLHHLVSGSAKKRGHAPALIFKDTTLVYIELWERIVAFGEGLTRIGLGRSQRVAVYLDKRIETVISIFGTSVAAGVFVPVNPLLRAKQVAHILDDCSVRVLVTSVERYELLRGELATCKSIEYVILVGTAAALAASDHYGVLAWDKLHSGGEVARAPDRGAIDTDVAAILYTSGSTGKPRGVVLSHRNLLAGAESVSQYLGNDQHDRILAALPLSFDAGFSQLTTGFLVGARIVLMNYLHPGDVVRLCAKHSITGLTCVPPLWIQLADQAWPVEVTRHMRYFANTGGRLPKVTLERLRMTFSAARPYLMYGLTEAFRSTYLDPAEVDRRPDSIGKAVPNAEILLVREDGTLCEPGEQGELVHRGALVAMGYWNDPEATAERFRPPPGRESGLCAPEIAVWSGDLAYRDDEGFLYFVSRIDEMIKTSGYRVSPTEIEEVVYDTGLACDAVALGLDDSRLGQSIVLVVAPPDGIALDSSALLAELRKRLPLYMLPKEVVVLPRIPRSPNGKFDRKLLRHELTLRDIEAR
ncbi:MAG: acyl-CoA ligase (AMP-forming), exosortase A system-associated [Actinomycetota bacterium]|nr:acyl-CoA ligase (AMP-forming), exosortase A system-associated [Actinomycetota bacterium]